MSGRQRKETPGLERVLRLADRAGYDDAQVQQLVAAAIATDNTHIRKRIERRLAATAVEQRTRPFDTPPSSALPQQERIRMGTTITGSEYTMPPNALTNHLLAVGKTGAGKTTLFYNLMEQITVPFWAFDLKQDYRHIVKDRDDVLVLPWTELKFNPLKPPDGVLPRQWAQVFSETFGHATALLSGSKNYLMQQIIHLYKLHELFDDSTGPYPSLHELQLVAERDKINYVRKTANYRDTLQNRLAAMNRTAGTIFDCSAGYPIEKLLDRNVVFEFNGLGTDLQNFLMEILLAYVYEYRLAQHQRGGDLRHVCFLDEGKRVFSVYKERQEAAGLPKIDELTAKLREFGESLVVADQEASKLTDSIKANTGTKILLSTGDAKQFREMADSMFLTDRQRELAKEVAVGEAIIQSGNQDPIPVNLQPYELDKTVTDQELQHHQTPKWNALSYEPRQRVPAFEAVIEGDGKADTTVDIPDDSTQSIVLSEDAEKLLVDVIEHPFKPLTERYEMFSNMEKGTDAKSELVDKSLIREQQITVPELRRKLLEVTETGRTYAEEELDREVQHEGRGGVIHRFWQHRIAAVFQDVGWSATVELFDADVYVNMDEVELAVEVAMGDNPREIEHIEDHLETFDAVWVACPNESVIDALQERLTEKDAIPESVKFRSFRFFSDNELALTD